MARSRRRQRGVDIEGTAGKDRIDRHAGLLRAGIARMADDGQHAIDARPPGDLHTEQGRSGDGEREQKLRIGNWCSGPEIQQLRGRDHCAGARRERCCHCQYPDPKAASH